MTTKALFVRLEAKPGKENEVAKFLRDGQGLVEFTGGVTITGGTLTTNIGGAIQGIGTATLSGLTISSG